MFFQFWITVKSYFNRVAAEVELQSAIYLYSICKNLNYLEPAEWEELHECPLCFFECSIRAGACILMYFLAGGSMYIQPVCSAECTNYSTCVKITDEIQKGIIENVRLRSCLLLQHCCYVHQIKKNEISCSAVPALFCSTLPACEIFCYCQWENSSL